MNWPIGNMPSTYDPESDHNQDLFVVPIEDVLDLHTVSPRDVEGVVHEYLSEARRLGFKAVRLIHGRGIGVQREVVRKVLASTAFIKSYGDAPAEAGGWGATIATLE